MMFRIVVRDERDKVEGFWGRTSFLAPHRLQTLPMHPLRTFLAALRRFFRPVSSLPGKPLDADAIGVHIATMNT